MSEDSDKNSYKETGKFIAETAVLTLILIGIPFLLSGIWPPFVSVISDSMEPNMTKGDMIFIVENERYAEEEAVSGISVKNNPNATGDVIIYYPNGDTTRTPVIHRAVIYAEEGENWVEQVDQTYVTSDNCAFTSNCPAPNSGFITLGDANSRYDQDADLSAPVKEDWIVGKAHQKIPFVGWVRILFDTLF